MLAGGYFGRALIVDVTDGTSQILRLPEEVLRAYVGGAGLVALRDGLCHIAGSHLLDPASGEYTLPYVDRVFGSSAPDVAVVRLVHRERGLMVAPGNPLRLGGIEDLTRPRKWAAVCGELRARAGLPGDRDGRARSSPRSPAEVRG